MISLRLDKILVVTGFPRSEGRNSEVVSLSTDAKRLLNCDDLKPYPLGVFGSTGALLNSSIPFVCGGFNGNDNTKNCYTVTKQSGIMTDPELERPVSTLLESREWAAGIVVGDFDETFFITGGVNSARQMITFSQKV